MIPLPHIVELVAGIIEIVILRKNRSLVAVRNGQRQRRLAVFAEDRPVILPDERHQNRNAAERAVILEEQAVPFVVGRIDDAALRNAAAVIAESGFEDDLALPVSGQRLAAPAVFGTRMSARPRDDEYIIVIADLVDMRTLAGQTGEIRFEERALAALEIGHIVIEFLDLDLAAAVDQILSAVRVKEHRGVVIHTAQLDAVPVAALDIVGGIDVGIAGAVASEEDIEFSVVIAQRGRPLAVRVVVLAVLEILLCAVCVLVIDIAADLP